MRNQHFGELRSLVQRRIAGSPDTARERVHFTACDPALHDFHITYIADQIKRHPTRFTPMAIMVPHHQLAHPLPLHISSGQVSMGTSAPVEFWPFDDPRYDDPEPFLKLWQSVASLHGYIGDVCLWVYASFGRICVRVGAYRFPDIAYPRSYNFRCVPFEHVDGFGLDADGWGEGVWRTLRASGGHREYSPNTTFNANYVKHTVSLLRQRYGKDYVQEDYWTTHEATFWSTYSRICHACDGDRMTLKPITLGGREHMTLDTCPECKGSGRVKDVRLNEMSQKAHTGWM